MAEEAVTAGTQSKSHFTYQWLRERISNGTYGPGYRLVLGQIAKELGVSVVPVREAIRLLEAEGLVTFQRNVGAQVAMADESEYRHTMESLALVEGYATALAAPTTTIEAIARARAINREMTECLDHFDPRRFTLLNREFHSAIYEHCPNPRVLELVHRGWDRLSSLRESTFSFVPGRARESVREHEEILRLIEQQASALDIEMAARRHRTATLDAYLEQQAEKQQ